ncbi:MAG: aspartate carbamoyltransferase regulatory subunit [Prevotellaceae bacterium]|jgi:aspartate carbamoyltransferase regulatory subunit|nr:aspartate carbamoyltransferase regulatory subunit [Prevotellaceae bacterium]
MESEKQLKVSAIKDGTVIDRIPSSQLFKVIEILGLEYCEKQITFGMNLESKHLGSKAIIKISGRFFEDDDINRIALIAPEAKFNVIKDYKVIEKRQVAVPETIVGIAKCFNPNCVTNHQPIVTRFHTLRTGENLALVCHYCEKITDAQHLQIITKNN